MNKTCALPSEKVFEGVPHQTLTQFCQRPIYFNTPEDQRHYSTLHAQFQSRTDAYSCIEFKTVREILINKFSIILASPHTISGASEAIYMNCYQPIQWNLSLTKDKLLELIHSFLNALHSFMSNQQNDSLY